MGRPSRPVQVFNLGLPRTGTTSLTNALKKLNLECDPVVAQRVAGNLAGRLTPFEPFEPPLEIPLICSTRERESWKRSLRAWRAGIELSDGYLDALYAHHAQWLESLSLRRKVGRLHVSEGYPGLFKALSKAYQGLGPGNAPLPRLNRTLRQGYSPA